MIPKEKISHFFEAILLVTNSGAAQDKFNIFYVF